MFTKQQLKKGFRGEVYQNGEFIGQAYLIDGRCYVAQVEDGVVRSHQERASSDFRKVGTIDYGYRKTGKWVLQ